MANKINQIAFGPRGVANLIPSVLSEITSELAWTMKFAAVFFRCQSQMHPFHLVLKTWPMRSAAALLLSPTQTFTLRRGKHF